MQGSEISLQQARVIFHLEEPRSWIISAEMNQFAAVHNFGAALRDDASGADGGGGLRGRHLFLGQRWTTMYVKDWVKVG